MSDLFPEFPSDRGEGSPDIGVGVDTIAVIGSTSENLLFELRHQELEREVDQVTGELRETPGYGFSDVQIGLAWVRVHGGRRAGNPWLRLELSTPTMLNGHNRNPLDRSFVGDVVDAALSVLSERLPDVPQIDQVTVARLDLTRDFRDVPSPSETLARLSRLHVPHARVHRVDYQPDGAVQTLTRGSSREWLSRGYDKRVQLLQRAQRDPAHADLLEAWADVSVGQLRFEVEVRRPLLRRKGLVLLSDLVPDVLEELAREYFLRAQWNQIIPGPARQRRILEDLRSSGVITPAEQRNLCVLLYSNLLGMDVPLTRHPLERSTALARRFGLAGAVAEEPQQRYLDFDRGIEVAV